MEKPSDSIEDRRQHPWALVETDLLRDPTITPQCKALYSLLITYGPQRIFPGQDTLAECLGTTRQTISRWLKELRSRGLIGWDQRKGTSNKYYILGYENMVPVTPVLHPCNTSVTPPVMPELHDPEPINQNQEQETADADFWGEDGKPKRGQEAEPLPETEDPLVLAGECAKRNGGKKSYTIPAEAGGADVFEDKPLRGFCALAGVQPDDLPKKKHRTWTRQLSNIAEEWEATPDLLYQAIRALPESADYGWVHPTSPYQSSFKEAIGVLITRIKANGGNGNAQKPPKVVIFPEPDYLMIPGQPHVTKGDLKAAFEKKRLEREKALAEMAGAS